MEVRVPDIGDFTEVDVVEVLVEPGARVKAEDSLITLESDKASMDVPAPKAGVVRELAVEVGSKVSEGDLIVVLEADEEEEEAAAPPPAESAESPAARASSGAAPAPARAGGRSGGDSFDAEVLVLGSGPGGYTAAFRAADLGKRVVLVERYPQLGGVCLNVGCIPSKALLHVARVIAEAAAFAEHGVTFGEPQIELDKLRRWKERVVGRLTGGLEQLAKRRRVEVVQGVGRFLSDHELEVSGEEGKRRLRFEQAIIAAGSRSTELPDLPQGDPRILDSTSALELDEIPERLLVIGGGIIGLEMATVYEALGSRITVVELLDRLMTGCDRDLVRVLERGIKKRYEAIHLATRVSRVSAEKGGLRVSFEGETKSGEELFDRVLVAVGRRSNGDLIDAQAAGVRLDERSFIPVDRQQRTNVPHIFAIGDIVGGPLLAHKASHQGKVAAEVAAGEASGFDARVIPNVAYTDPEVAWVGVTEEEARERGIEYGKGSFPWSASGRSLAMGREDGVTKLLFEGGGVGEGEGDGQGEGEGGPGRRPGRLIGGGIVGSNAGDLIAEVGLAIEMGADAADIALTVHAHPTLSETVGFAAEAFEGTLTDLYLGRGGRS